MTADPRGYVFTYDHENRLRKVEKAGTPGAVLATFRYDALGRRVEMIDESVTPAVVTRYVYDGDNVVAAYEDVGGTWVRQRYYVHGATYIDERAVVHDDGADRDYYTVLDDLYTVAGLADEVGNVFESYDVDAYGTPTMTAHTFSDFDGDGDVDPADFLTISNCYNGSLNPPKPGCANPMADLDRDGDVDGADFLTFNNCYNGAMNPPKCSPSDFAVGSSPVGNVYFFTGRRLDAFDFSSGGGASGGGAAPSSGGGLLGGMEATSSADVSFWLCFYSSLGGAKNPLDFDGDIDGDDLAWLDKCISDAGGSTESTSAPAPLLPDPLGGGSAMASAGSTAGLVLYHYRARAHDPGLGRFMQRDPLGYVDGLNLYEYVQSRPIRGLDPFGSQELGWPDPGLDLIAYGCCNGQKYDKMTHCCEDDQIVSKVDLWFCKRSINTGNWYDWPLWLLQFRHCYVCCDGPNKNCYSKGPHNTKPGKIDHEQSTTGKCKLRKVCPKSKNSKCNNPTTDTAYDVVTNNCCTWAYEGITGL